MDVGWSRALSSSLRYASLRIHLRAHQRVLMMCILAQWHLVALGAAAATRRLRCSQGCRRWCRHALAQRSRTTHVMRLLLPRRNVTARALRRLRAVCWVARSQQRQTAARVIAATNLRAIRLAQAWERWRARARECALARLLDSATREKTVAAASRLSFRRMRSAAVAAQACRVAFERAARERAWASAKLQQWRRRRAVRQFRSACQIQSRARVAARDRASGFAELLRWRRRHALRGLRTVCVAVGLRHQRLALALRLLRRQLLRCWLAHAANLAIHRAGCASAAKAIGRLRKQRALRLMQRYSTRQDAALELRARWDALVRRRAMRSWRAVTADAHSDSRLTQALLLRLSAQRQDGGREDWLHDDAILQIRHHPTSPSRAAAGHPATHARHLAVLARGWRRLLSCLASRRLCRELGHCRSLCARGLHRRASAVACLRQWAAEAACRAVALAHARQCRLSRLRLGLWRWCRARARGDAAVGRALLARVHADLGSLRFGWRALGVAGAVLTTRRLRLARARSYFFREGSACRVELDLRRVNDHPHSPPRQPGPEGISPRQGTRGHVRQRPPIPLGTILNNQDRDGGRAMASANACACSAPAVDDRASPTTGAWVRPTDGTWVLASRPAHDLHMLMDSVAFGGCAHGFRAHGRLASTGVAAEWTRD